MEQTDQFTRPVLAGPPQSAGGAKLVAVPLPELTIKKGGADDTHGVTTVGDLGSVGIVGHPAILPEPEPYSEGTRRSATTGR